MWRFQLRSTLCQVSICAYRIVLVAVCTQDHRFWQSIIEIIKHSRYLSLQVGVIYAALYNPHTRTRLFGIVQQDHLDLNRKLVVVSQH